MTSPAARPTIIALDKLQTPIMVVVIENDEQRLQLAPESIANGLEDRDEVGVLKVGRNGGNGCMKL